MPLVADELGQLELYGWVYSAFFLGSLIGIVVSGGALDRMPIARPFAVGLGLFALGLAIGGLAPSMLVLVGGALHPGPGRRHGRADGVRRDRPGAPRAPPAAHVRDALDRVGHPRDHRAVDRGGRRRGRVVAARVPRPDPVPRRRRRARAVRAAPRARRRGAVASTRPPRRPSPACRTRCSPPPGAGILVAALTIQQPVAVVGGAALGLALLRAGVPAADARRGPSRSPSGCRPP